MEEEQYRRLRWEFNCHFSKKIVIFLCMPRTYRTSLVYLLYWLIQFSVIVESPWSWSLADFNKRIETTRRRTALLQNIGVEWPTVNRPPTIAYKCKTSLERGLGLGWWLSILMWSLPWPCPAFPYPIDTWGCNPANRCPGTFPTL